jgi:hypothetical protein
MEWLSVGAMLDDQRYTLSRGLTLLAAIGAAASVVVAVVLVRRRRPGDAPRGWGAPAVAGCALAASLLAALTGRRAASIADLFPGTYGGDLAAIVVAGLAAIFVAFRARSPAALAILLPAWLLAQCGLVHARALHELPPRILALGIQTVQVGHTAHPHPVVSEAASYIADEVSLSPRERGEHEVVVRATGDQISVERTLRFHAVEERADPMLPLRPGNHWLLRSADGRAEMTIEVGSSRVEDGLRWYEVTVRAEGRNDAGRVVTVDGPHRVYEADGRILKLDGTPFVSGLAALPGGEGHHCELNRELTCECAETTAPPARLLAGPIRCHWRHSTTRGLGELGLAVIAQLATLGQADTSALERKITTEVDAEHDLELVRSEPRQEGSTPR